MKGGVGKKVSSVQSSAYHMCSCSLSQGNLASAVGQTRGESIPGKHAHPLTCLERPLCSNLWVDGQGLMVHSWAR